MLEADIIKQTEVKEKKNEMGYSGNYFLKPSSTTKILSNVLKPYKVVRIILKMDKGRT